MIFSLPKTFIHYRGRGFWAGGFEIKTWLCLLAIEIDLTPDVPVWLMEARAFWREEGSGEWTGAVSGRLDEVVTSPERLTAVIALCERLLARLRTGPHAPYPQQTHTHFVQQAEAWIAEDAARADGDRDGDVDEDCDADVDRDADFDTDEDVDEGADMDEDADMDADARIDTRLDANGDSFIERVGEAFVRLLRGEIGLGAKDAPRIR